VTLVWSSLGGTVLLFLAIWSLSVLMHAENHRGFISRWAAMTNQLVSYPPLQFVRSVISLTLLTATLGLGVLVGPLMNSLEPLPAVRAGTGGVSLADFALPVNLLLLGMIVVLASVTLVTSRTGRPKFLVLRPCRGASRAEVERWLSVR